MSTEKTPERKPARARWLAERFLATAPRVEPSGGTEDAAEVGKSTEYLRRRRFIEFALLPGRVSGRLGGDDDGQSRIELVCRVFSDAEWDAAFTRWSEGSFFMACLLAGEFPEELDDALETPLCPRAGEVQILIGGRPAEQITREAAMMISRFCERLEEDPGAIFLLRGKPREDVLLELWNRRRRLRATLRRQQRETAPASSPQPAEPLSIARFWSIDPAIFSLHYALRADELPASVLKRLDQLPATVNGDSVDRLFEEAYAQVAIRAQAYAIGL